MPSSFETGCKNTKESIDPQNVFATEQSDVPGKERMENPFGTFSQSSASREIK